MSVSRISASFILGAALLAPGAASAAPTTGAQVTGAAAESAVGTLDPQAVSEITQFWNTYDVSSDVQESLLEDLATDGTFDAGSPAAEPVDERVVRNGDRLEQVQTFADGSIMVMTELDIASEGENAGASARANNAQINGCRVTSGSGFATYSGCYVSGSNGNANIEFTVSYEEYQGAAAKILAVGRADVSARFGEMTAAEKITDRRQSTSAVEALVTYQSRYTSSVASQDIYLSFRLPWKGPGRATTF